MRQDSTRCREQVPERLCVLVADGDGLARESIRASLDELTRIGIVLGARDEQEAIELTGHYRPAVTVLEVGLPSPASLGETVAELCAASPATRLLTLSACEDDRCALAALRAGAVGHLCKEAGPAVLAREVQRAADGEAIVPRRLTMALVELVHELPDAGWRPLRSRLTTREWEVIDLLGDGAGTQRIADALVVSTTTVYSHIKSVMRKLDVHSRADAVRAADALRHEEALGGELRMVAA